MGKFTILIINIIQNIMKKIMVIVFLTWSSVVFSQKYMEPWSQKAIDKNYVKVDSTLYCCKYEATNVDYREFLADLKKSGKNDEYQKALPDTLGWRDKLAYNEPYVELYFRHPAYQNYPMVNISYEQAIIFCDWLTKKYNLLMNKKFKKVLFRLPSKEEWEKTAHGGLKENVYPWKEDYLLNTECKYLCNFRRFGDEGVTYDTLTKKFIATNQDKMGMTGLLNDHSELTAPVESYYPNGFGIFNMSGNVSEMIKEKGIAKGGSWISPGYDVRIQSNEFYTKSCTHIGFRVFMEVIEL